MPNPTTSDYKQFENRQFAEPVVFTGGVDQETPKFVARRGTLLDAMNYSMSPRGYSRNMGLLQFDGHIDEVATNLYLVETTTLESSSNPVGSGYAWATFFSGWPLVWGENLENSGVLYYYFYDTDFSPSFHRIYHFGLKDIVGDPPVEGDTLTDPVTGDNIVLGDVSAMAVPPYAIEDGPNGVPITQEEFAALAEGYVYNNFYGVDRGAIYGIDEYAERGKIPGVGAILGGFQYKDEVYAVRSAYTVNYDVTSYPDTVFNIGDHISMRADVSSVGADTEVDFNVIEVISRGGADSNVGTLVLVPALALNPSLQDYRGYAANSDNYWESGGAWSGTIRDETDVAIADIDFTLDKIYPSALLWKATPFGWVYQPPSWTMDFNNGANAPNVKLAPLFQSDLAIGAKPTGDVDGDAATGDKTYLGNGVSWNTPANALTNNSTDTDAALPNTGDITDTLEIAYTGTDYIPSSDAQIVGIEVDVKYRGTAGTGSADIPVVKIGTSNVPLASTSERTLSENRAQAAVSVTGPTSYATATYGGEADLWGLESMDSSVVNSGDFLIALRARNAGGGSITIAIDYVTVRFFYKVRTEHLHAYDLSTGTDIGEADVVAYQQEGGTFGEDDTAYGNMTLTNVTNPGDWTVGLELYTGPSATGDRVADVVTPPTANTFPGQDLWEDAGQPFYQTIKANFYENDESESIYGCTGAGPAFAYGPEGLTFIRTPLSPELDKPRHVAFHDNRLALGFREGSVALSALGVPNDFAGATGADPSLWGVGDRVTGLISERGDSLIVFSESSTRALRGSGEESGSMQVISPNVGAREYTVARMGMPIFVDNRGVAGLTTTDRYGDFEIGRLTATVSTWLKERLQNRSLVNYFYDDPVCAVHIRNRQEYRLFFNDGYNLILYFDDEGNIHPTFQNYTTAESYGVIGFGEYTDEYTPTWIDSTVQASGRERVIMGTSSGYVFVVDAANMIVRQSTTRLVDEEWVPETFSNSGYHFRYPECWITLNPINAADISRLGKNFYAELYAHVFNYETIAAMTDTNYVFNRAMDSSSKFDERKDVGDPTADVSFVTNTALTRFYLPTLTDGMTVRFQSRMDGQFPHSLQAMVLRASAGGAHRNRASTEY